MGNRDWPLAAEGEGPARWQPWPVESPRSDHLAIRWPSDDWPVGESRITVEDTLPDAPVQIIEWRQTGGLLDMWV